MGKKKATKKKKKIEKRGKVVKNLVRDGPLETLREKNETAGAL